MKKQFNNKPKATFNLSDIEVFYSLSEAVGEKYEANYVDSSGNVDLNRGVERLFTILHRN